MAVNVIEVFYAFQNFGEKIAAATSLMKAPERKEKAIKRAKDRLEEFCKLHNLDIDFTYNKET